MTIFGIACTQEASVVDASANGITVWTASPAESLPIVPEPTDAPTATPQASPAPVPDPTSTPNPTATATATPTRADIVSMIRDAVVRIETDDGSVGTGMIIDPDGHILTNSHVIEGANSLSVFLDDGSYFDARIIGQDADMDVAMLKIIGNDLPVIPLGSSGQLSEGDDVTALGYALDLQGSITVTRGIVSAFREGHVEGMRYIQTDAAINHGNSGGPLINSTGEVIGMNTLAIRELENVVADGIGFAISSDDLKPQIEALKTGLYVDTSIPEAWSDYLSADYAYSIDIPPGWMVDDETPEFVAVHGPNASLWISVVNDFNKSLEEVEYSRIREVSEATPSLFEFVSRSEIILDSGLVVIRVDYRVQETPGTCVKHIVELLASVSPAAYGLIGGGCESDLSDFQTDLILMMESLTVTPTQAAPVSTLIFVHPERTWQVTYPDDWEIEGPKMADNELPYEITNFRRVSEEGYAEIIVETSDNSEATTVKGFADNYMNVLEDVTTSFKLISTEEIELDGNVAYESVYFDTYGSTHFATISLHLVVGDQKYHVAVTTTAERWITDQALLHELARSFVVLSP